MSVKQLQLYLLLILVNTGSIVKAQIIQIPPSEKKQPSDQLLDEKLTDTIRSSYLFIDEYYQGRARFHHPNCYWGYLDENQKEIKTEQFDWVGNFSHYPFARVDLKRGEAIINRQAELISPIASYVNWEARGDYFILTTYKPDKYAISDKNGKLLSDFETDQITYVNDSLFILTKGIRQSIWNLKQPEHSLFEFMDIQFNTSTQYFAAAKRTRRYGIINQKGETVLPFKYAASKTFGDYPVFAVQDPKTELWGFKNAADDIILDFRYYLADLNLTVVSNNQIAILEDDKWVIYDHNGVELAKYDDYIDIFKFSDQVIGIKKGTKCYLLDEEGLIFSDRFDRYSFLGPYYYVNKNNKYGLFDKFGKELIPSDYDLVKAADSAFRYFTAYNWKGVFLYNIEKDSCLFEKLDTIISHRNSPYLSLIKDGKEQIFDKNKDKVVTYWTNQQQKIYPNLNRYLQKSGQLWYMQDSLGDRLYLRGFEEVREVLDQYANKVEALALRVGDDWFYEDGDTSLITSFPYPISQLLKTDIGGYYLIQKEQNDSLFQGLIRKKDGKILAEPIYSSIAYLKDGFFVLRTPNYNSVVDSLGRLILREQYDQEIQISGDYILTRPSYAYEYKLYEKASGRALLRMENTRIVDANLSIGVLILEKGEEMAAYNLEQKELIGWDKHQLSLEDGGMIQATKGLHKYWYDKDGSWIECYRKKALPPLRFFD